LPQDYTITLIGQQIEAVQPLKVHRQKEAEHTFAAELQSLKEPLGAAAERRNPEMMRKGNHSRDIRYLIYI
jgi:hypothetical protein